MTERVTIAINGTEVTADVEPRLLLAHFIRDVANLTGTHVGCDTTSCGACTVLLDGKAVKSCTIFAIQANGKKVMTVEGLATNGTLHPIQEGFHEKHGLQCGFCTPGMMLTTYAFLEKNKDPHPNDDDIRWAISGNLCRCTGYMNIVEAVKYAANKMHSSVLAEMVGGEENA